MKHIKRVWVGIVDGKPHAFDCDVDGAGCVAVYTTKKEAQRKYQDVRRAELIVDEQATRRR